MRGFYAYICGSQGRQTCFLGLTKKGLHLSMFRFRGTMLCIGMPTFGRSKDRAGRKAICVPRDVPHESPMFRTCAPNLHRLGASSASTFLCKPLLFPFDSSAPKLTRRRQFTGLAGAFAEPAGGASQPSPIRGRRLRTRVKGPVSEPHPTCQPPSALSSRASHSVSAAASCACLSANASAAFRNLSGSRA